MRTHASCNPSEPPDTAQRNPSPLLAVPTKPRELLSNWLKTTKLCASPAPLLDVQESPAAAEHLYAQRTHAITPTRKGQLLCTHTALLSPRPALACHISHLSFLRNQSRPVPSRVSDTVSVASVPLSSTTHALFAVSGHTAAPPRPCHSGARHTAPLTATVPQQ